MASAWNWMRSIVGTRSAVSKMKWVKVQLCSSVMSLNSPAVTCLRALTSLEPRMYAKYMHMLFIFVFILLYSLSVGLHWRLMPSNLPSCVGVPVFAWLWRHQLGTNSQWIHRKLFSGHWQKLLFRYESSAYSGLDAVCFIHPWLANWFFWKGSLDLRGHRLYASQISVRYRINESGRLNVFNLNNPSATALPASNGWRGGSEFWSFC